MNDTLMRQWHMLRLVPRHPLKVSTSSLQNDLAREGFSTTQRTIQRDLISLSTLFPLVCDDRSKPFGWSWGKNANVLDIPGMDAHTALAFKLAQKQLEPLLPIATARHLQAHFKTAENILKNLPSKQGTANWATKVRVLQQGPHLKTPVINNKVQAVIYESLLINRRVSLSYNPRSGKQKENAEVHLLGMVMKDGICYLICSFWEYTDIRVIALHRVSKATLLDTPVNIPKDFDLDQYLAQGELSIIEGDAFQLQARLSLGTQFHLSERPLSDDQTITQQENGDWHLNATVQNTSELRWWILSHATNIEILSPPALRNELKEITLNMAKMYD
ncbi:MAG: WYL domain-containing protein [Zetaproteobacteria bacterium]|nr:WYL domain-containing protein [Zetaproteobacteria bacterium]